MQVSLGTFLFATLFSISYLFRFLQSFQLDLLERHDMQQASLPYHAGYYWDHWVLTSHINHLRPLSTWALMVNAFSQDPLIPSITPCENIIRQLS